MAICPLTSLGHASTLSPVSYVADNFEASNRNSKFGMESIKLNPAGASAKSPNDIVPVCSYDGPVVPFGPAGPRGPVFPCGPV